MWIVCVFTYRATRFNFGEIDVFLLRVMYNNSLSADDSHENAYFILSAPNSYFARPFNYTIKVVTNEKKNL